MSDSLTSTVSDSRKPSVLLLDGSVSGAEGNTARALDHVAEHLSGRARVERVVLASYGGTVEALAGLLTLSDGLVVGTGCYWGSWGSPLSRFLEVMTPHEATEVFVGKPAIVVVTMDSTGGAEVAVRLAGVLSCLGCLVPPFGWMALSRVGVALGELEPSAVTDVWGAPDLEILADNLLLATASPREPWRAWDVDRAEPVRGPFATARPPSGVVVPFLKRARLTER